MSKIPQSKTSRAAISKVLEIEILFEDQDLLVINKPAGIVVNQAESVKTKTIQEWAAERIFGAEFKKENKKKWQNLVPADFDPQYGTPVEIFEQRQGIVHRLDKDTSGVLILAKNPGSLANLLAQFRKREIKKSYIALTHGKFRVERGRISAPLSRSRADRQKFAVDATGRKAVTEYRVVKFYKDLAPEGKELLQKEKKKLSLYQGFSLVECFPQTGRTHQLRVHLKHWKHPIVGDDKYVGKKRAKLDQKWCPRQFLHASQIQFMHPRTQEKLEIEAPLSQDLENALKLLVAD